MPEDIKVLAKRIDLLAKNVKKYKENKKKFENVLAELKNRYPDETIYKKKADELLKGRTEKDWIAYFDSQVDQALNEIETKNKEIKNQLDPSQKITPKKGVKQGELIFYLSKKEEKRYKKELNIDEEYLDLLRPKKEDKNLILEDYTVYEANPYGKIANKFVEKYTEKLIKNAPKMYEDLVYALRTANTKILSKTYVSMMLFTSIIVTLITILFMIPLMLISAEITAFKIIQVLFQGITLSLFTGIITAVIFYMYPVSQAKNKRRQIKNEIPFVIIHMAAVAGSGAQPISMFNLVFKSGEYKSLEGDIKKIINYVNLFGYNISTALRIVSLTTPSAEFRELLTGLVTTIETGGSLKQYLTSKAQDAMVNYKLERKKYNESLSTYSDMYTGIFIAAPLLFFVTLAIIDMMGGAIMGLSVNMLAMTGTYAILPMLNLAFLGFLSFVQPE